MSKVIGIGALNENTRRFYEDVLKNVLENEYKIKSYNFAKYDGDIIDDDIILVSTPLMINMVKKFLGNDTKIIPIGRTFTKKSYEILKTIPQNIDALLINNGIDVTFETISLLYKLGFKFNLFPYYPGQEAKKGVDIAITTDEEHLVPPSIKKVYNIGHMVYDMNTMLDLLNHLEFDNNKRQKILHQYQKKIIPVGIGIPTMFSSNVMIKEEMKIILDSINEGVIEINNIGIISMINNKAEEVLGIKEKEILGKHINDVFVKDKININNLVDIDNKFINYNKGNLIVNISPIHVFDKKIGNIITIKDITEISKLEERVRSEISIQGYTAKYTIKDIIGNNDKILKTKELAKRMAKSNASVLIIGESGTGKELFAQTIHNASKRSKFPFVAINCAAMPENLIESELFGYEGGAFTGAKKEGKPGLFEQAHLGTIFLDELGDLGLNIQAKLLRVLQEGEVVRIGSTKIRKIDVRVISATNKNLLKLAEEGKFRWDLYYRLNVFPLRIPPLRERKEDIELIFKYFLNQFNCDKKVSNKVIKTLSLHNWNGNVRELRNLAEYLSEMGSDPIDVSDLPFMLAEKLEIGNDELDSVENEILKILYDKLKKKQKIGRKKLIEILEDSKYYLTEKEVRSKLYSLQNKDLVNIGRGRQGTKLTKKGLEYIECV